MRRTCALTGHRQLPPDFDRNALYDKLEELVVGGCDTFLCGMAAGFDLLALQCLAELKQKYRIFIEGCIPYVGQENGYPIRERQNYRTLLAWCDRKTVLFAGFCNGCYLARDRYMVDCADVVLAYCKRETGGTAYTVRYAQRKQIPVEFL